MKKSRKTILWLLILFCFIPLFSKIDNYEDFLASNYYQSEWIYNYSNATVTWEYAHFKSSNDKNCYSKYDWSTINARYIPFWILVTACSNDYYIHLFSSPIKFHFTKNSD